MTHRLPSTPPTQSVPPTARRLATLPFLAAIYLYRFTLGPLLGGQCRFYPTCSQYGLDAYRLHGPVRGSWLTLRRLLRCHPFGGRGIDPVPPPRPPDHAPTFGRDSSKNAPEPAANPVNPAK